MRCSALILSALLVLTVPVWAVPEKAPSKLVVLP
jgi:hypothetical protein